MANTTTLREALCWVAEATGETRNAFISAVDSQTILEVRGLSLGQSVTFKYAIAKVSGKGVRQITAYNETTQKITLESAFDSNVAAGEFVSVCWWDADKTATAVSAINAAVLQSYPLYYREKKTRNALTGTVAASGTTAVTGTSTLFLEELVAGDAIKINDVAYTVSSITSNTALTTSASVTTTSGATAYYASNLTFTSGTHVYQLPSSLSELISIGVRMSSRDPVSWTPPLKRWKVLGTYGKYYLHLGNMANWITFNQDVSTAFASPMVGGGTMADIYSGYDIELHYISREPLYSSLTSTTNLPLNYFDTAAEIYMSYRLAALDPSEPQYVRYQSLMPMISAKAVLAREWLNNSNIQIAVLKGPTLQI